MSKQRRRPKVVDAAMVEAAMIETVRVETAERDMAFAAAHQATLARTRYHLLEERAVKHGRSGGVSWDEMGRWLLCPGESLRRRYGSQAG